MRRFQSLDVLRGIFLSMAMWQHYTYFSDTWYASPFPMNPGAYWLSMIFTPWVSQVFVFMACLNLTLSENSSLKSRRIKWFIYAVLMAVESFLIWPDWADSLTPPAIHMGILTMFIVSALAQRGGWRTVAVALAVYCALLNNVLIPLGDNLESAVQRTWDFPDWEYNARLEYFLGTGLLGFLVGTLVKQRSKPYMKWLMITSLIGPIPCWIWGHRYNLPEFDVFTQEYFLSRNLLDLTGLWALITFIISSFVYLELSQVKFTWAKPLIWISLNTWTIFAVHRLIYIYIYGPTLERLADRGLGPAHPSMGFMIGLSYVTCGLVYLAMGLILKYKPRRKGEA